MAILLCSEARTEDGTQLERWGKKRESLQMAPLALGFPAPGAARSLVCVQCILFVFWKTEFYRLLFLYLDTNPLGIWKGNKQFPAAQVEGICTNCASTSRGPFR